MLQLPEWARAHGPVVAYGRLRAAPEDFEVEEVLGFDADGAGEHWLLRVEKRGANTFWVARQLARYAGIPVRDVSYAGLKDRQAVAVQHFSLWLGKRAVPDWEALTDPEFRVLGAVRHGRKLRRGALKGNRFHLVLRQLSTPVCELKPRLETIRACGVPNYFGPQRFGRDGANIEQAVRAFADPRLLRDRRQRGLLLSAARGLIFNAVLSQRVEGGTWNTLEPGELCMLDGSHSVFHAGGIDAELKGRCAAGDVHPSGPLWGRGEAPVSGEVRERERRVANLYAELARGLEAAGLEPARRALRLPVRDFIWRVREPDILELEFFLPAGAYATAVVREVLEPQTTDAGDDDADED